MKVREVIAKLSTMDPDFDVVICIEGIHSLDHISVGALDKEEMDEAPEGTPNNVVALSTDD